MGFISEWKKRSLVGNETEEIAKGRGTHLDFTGTVMENHWKFFEQGCGQMWHVL